MTYGTRPFGDLPFGVEERLASVADAGAAASAEAFGAPILVAHAEIAAAGDIASTEAIGAAEVATRAELVAVGALGSGQAFGAPLVVTRLDIAPDSIVSAEVFGWPGVSTSENPAIVDAGDITGAETFGEPALMASTVAPERVSIVAGVPIPLLRGRLHRRRRVAQIVDPGAIASAEVFGRPTVATRYAVQAEAIASAEAFGAPVVSDDAYSDEEMIAMAVLAGYPPVAFIRSTSSRASARA